VDVSQLAETDRAEARGRNAATAIKRFWKDTKGMPADLRDALTRHFAHAEFNYPSTIEEDNIGDDDDEDEDE
jgi:hypothetical protein